jgi:hypothetical protein
LVVDPRIFKLKLASQFVTKSSHSIGRHLEPHHMGLAGTGPGQRRRRVKVAAMTIIPRLLPRSSLLLSQLIQALTAAEAAISSLIFENVFDMLPVNGGAF